jgi:hypothetical protein
MKQRDDGEEESVMHNFFTVEVEAGLRRQELEREAAAEAQATLAGRAVQKRRWLPRVIRTLAHLSSLTLPTVPLGTPLEMRRVSRPVEC